ncbi:hypothetical protein PVAP13_9KG409001 [Panicum virgatum]|uniref:Uncharacterized protein n=1 Tax=Panicum virgatum TaxID=38727 RepID=A0A8T0NTL1_PANVG|nr:hypothetical protein PVAP13_9KG409001 [Panicum virgatum]
MMQRPLNGLHSLDRSLHKSHHDEPREPNNRAATATSAARRRWHDDDGHARRRRRGGRSPPREQAHAPPARLPHLLRGRRRAVRGRARGQGVGPALRAPGLPRLPLRVGRPGVARHRRARRRAPGQRRLRPVGRPRLRPAGRLTARDLEVLQLRRQHRRVPGARRRLPRPGRPRQQGAHGHGGRHDGAAVPGELRGAQHCRVGRRGAGARVPGAVRAHGGVGGANGAAAAVDGGAGEGEQGLEALPEHAVLEPQLLGQREHDGWGGGAAGADVPAGARRGGGPDRRQLPAAAHGGDRRHGRAAGGLGERLPGRCCRHDRGVMAQVLDRGRRGAVVDRHVRGPAEQRRVPAAGHGGPGPPPTRLRPPRDQIPHPVGGHRRRLRRHPRRLLPGVRRRRGHRPLPLRPGHAARVRRLPLAPRAPARDQAALPRAAPAPRAGGHVRRAVRVPGLRVRVAGRRVLALAGALTALGAGLHGAMRLSRSKMWLRFNTAAEEDHHGNHAAGHRV